MKKKRSLAKIIEILENCDLCNVWRIKNTKTKRFTFIQKHFSRLIRSRLDNFFISNILQEFVKHTDILASLSSNLSPILVSLMKSVIPERGTGLCKFNYSLQHNAKIIEEMKIHITASLKNFNEQNIRNENIKWKMLKYEMRKLSKYFSRQVSFELNKERKALGKETKILTFLSLDYNHEYMTCENKFKTIYDDIANGIKVKSHYVWFEYGKKSLFFFFFFQILKNMEKLKSNPLHSL